jgi:choline kinase
MLDFMGKTIIERQIELYHQYGIYNIIVVKGFAGDKICYPNITYYTNKEYATTNMVESLMTAKAEFDDDIIVSYSDILFEGRLLEQMMKCSSDFAVAVDKNWKEYWKKRYSKIDFDTESLSLDQDGNIIELGRENPNLNDIDARYIGLLKFSKNGLNYITNLLNDAYSNYCDKPWQQSGKTIRKAYMTDLLNAIIESGKTVKAEIFSNGWIEFDTNEDYEKAIMWVNDKSIGQIFHQ